jgi:hypothetical protein
MGKQQRRRRAAKKHQADLRRERARASGYDLRLDVAELVGEALAHTVCADTSACRAERDRALATLAAESEDAAWSRTVDAALFEWNLVALEELCWPRGWQPGDLAHVTKRELGGEARRCLIDLMAAELRRYAPTAVEDSWHDQLDELGASVWWSTDVEYVRELATARGMTRTGVVRTLLRLLSLLRRLPALEQLSALPGAAHGTGTTSARTADDVDEKLLTRVRALLAQAESTNYEAEAETFTAAAQAMMARHSIDAAMLRGNADQGGRFDSDGPRGVRLAVDNPYAEPKALLLQQIAEANSCRTVWDKRIGLSTLVGFPADTAWVALLYTSLLVQANTAIARAGSKVTRQGTSRTRAFRATFLAGFATRIGERLRETTSQAQDEALAATGPSLLPVLASREQEVDDELSRIFPTVHQRGRARWATDYEGWHAGRTAADLADLAQNRAVAGS